MALIDDKVKIYLRVNMDAELSDLSGNTTWYNSAQIMSGGVHNGYCLYFDNINKTNELYSTSIPSGTLDFSESKWTISFWAKITTLIQNGGEITNSTFGYDNAVLPFFITTGSGTNIKYMVFVRMQVSEFGNMVNPQVSAIAGSNVINNEFLPLSSNVLNNWAHFALVKNTNSICFYVNGTKFTLISDYNSWANSNNPDFDDTDIMINFFKSGSVTDSTSYESMWYRCYLDEFCIVEDALWTDTFTPPTSYLYNLPSVTHKKWPSASWNMFKYNFKRFHDQTIQGLESLLENIVDYGTFYGTCTSTSASTTKYVTCPNFVLKTGAKVIVLFSNANSAAAENLKMNVNNTGAKEIYYKGTSLPSNTIVAGSCLEFVYDGTRYQLVGC